MATHRTVNDQYSKPSKYRSLVPLGGAGVIMIVLAACRRERSKGLASCSAGAHVIHGTSRGRERNTITGRTPSVMMRGVELQACRRSRVRPRIRYGSASD